jgi:hypothetical protein
MTIRSKIRTAGLVVAGMALIGSAAAAGPVEVALEKVTGDSSGVEFMDYVHTGQVILLGSGDTIVLGYLHSCVRETITGGLVTVGSNQSEVQTGTVSRTRVQCDPGRASVTHEQSNVFAGRIFRGVKNSP